MPQPSVITAPAHIARCLLAPLAARADDGVFVRFQVPEPAGQVIHVGTRPFTFQEILP